MALGSAQMTCFEWNEDNMRKAFSSEPFPLRLRREILRIRILLFEMRSIAAQNILMNVG